MGKEIARQTTRPVSLKSFAGIAAAIEPIKDELNAMVPLSALKQKEPGKDVIYGHERYNRDTVATILRTLAGCGTYEDAATATGVSSRTIRKWRSQHEDFAIACERARGLLRIGLVDRVIEGAKKNPRLALDLLERLFPDQYAPTKRVEQSGSVAHRVEPSRLLLQLQQSRQKVDASDSVSSAKVIEAEEISEKPE